jgi:hypothetical protein
MADILFFLARVFAALSMLTLLSCGGAQSTRGSSANDRDVETSSDPVSSPRPVDESSTSETQVDPSDDLPLDESGCSGPTTCGSGGRGSSCGTMGCPGREIVCGCQWNLECQGGMCMPRHQTCDPVSPRDVCPEPGGPGEACGQVSAGCPGANVTCACKSGLRCVDGHCR